MPDGRGGAPLVGDVDLGDGATVTLDPLEPEPQRVPGSQSRLAREVELGSEHRSMGSTWKSGTSG